jgi:hypothetical protein
MFSEARNKAVQLSGKHVIDSQFINFADPVIASPWRPSSVFGVPIGASRNARLIAPAMPAGRNTEGARPATMFAFSCAGF